ncbi:hypothetical protein NDU88_009320 [Pleurodeles waltl]|uniref:Uncharacterized protein n=1 Tax=Pleurodeles waltl TaxID=8319 RepID=A0AAV7PUG0_PLEWA|nr:hypothetical protein NDU88_009320 [Pleurodeles waltl]
MSTGHGAGSVVIIAEALSSCSRLSGDAAPSTEWLCSRSRQNSVSSCHDDRGAGVSDIHPDFRGRGTLKRENGREEERRESNADTWQRIGTPDAEKNDQEQHRVDPENLDGVKKAEDRRNEEPSEDTLRTRPVPGGAWLTKPSTTVVLVCGRRLPAVLCTRERNPFGTGFLYKETALGDGEQLPHLPRLFLLFLRIDDPRACHTDVISLKLK